MKHLHRLIERFKLMGYGQSAPGGRGPLVQLGRTEVGLADSAGDIYGGDGGSVKRKPTSGAVAGITARFSGITTQACTPCILAARAKACP